MALILLILASCAQVEEKREKNDWKEMNLRDKVKSISESTYYTSEGDSVYNGADKIPGFETTKTDITFTINGWIDQKAVYIAKGNLLINRMVNSFLPDGRIEVSRNYIGNDSLISYMEYDFEDNGELEETKTYNPKGGLIHETDYEYDNKGNLTEVKVESDNDITILTHTYVNDSKGYPTELTTYYAASNMVLKTVYKRDPNGRLLEETTYRPDGSVAMTQTFNELGDLTQMKSNNHTVDYTYEYDHKHNWIKSTISDNGKLKFTKERVLTYFD